MYRKEIFLILIVIMAVIVMKVTPRGENETMRTEGSDAVYIAQMRAKGLSCVMYINGISLSDNLDYNMYQTMSQSERIGYALSEGQNRISLQVIDLLERENVFCELTIFRLLYEGVKEDELPNAEEVTSMRITVETLPSTAGEPPHYRFTTQESKAYPDSSLTDTPTLTILDGSAYSGEGLLNDVLVSRTLFVDHRHRSHSWSYRSTPVEDNEETFRLVWQKYMTMRKAFASKDFEQLAASMQPGIGETERYQGDPDTKSWTRSILEPITLYAWKAPDFKLLPPNPDNYELQVEAGGRLFRLNSKKSLFKDGSPIEWQENGRVYTYSKTFTLVNGRVVVAW